ncbi:Hypothetical predicted protein [Olea europaea subsp. europaea]|uniref:Uncharacterized protein n=1 Tax=Olea europaea subsp. europaea TaxID=158383 RepID=A0A8S0Q4Q0_OLEEU|nr:Hypothetical predicted protein [Olea europaea subsp. europaea]
MIRTAKSPSMAAAAIKCLITHVLGLLVEVMSKGIEKHLTSVLQAMRRILQFAVIALTSEQDLYDGAVIPWWKEASCSFIMFK